MDIERIIADLNRRFAAPLPEFYPRRIIVWHDEEQEFADAIGEMQLESAKIAALTGTNYFAVKKLLAVDDTDSNYLLYVPAFYETPEDNWLLDIELYSEEFRADLISMWMSEMGLPQTPRLRNAIRPYRKFMNAKDRRRKIMAQKALPTTAVELQLSIMAALAGVRDATPAAVIKGVLKGGLDPAANHLWQDFEGYEIADVFWRMAAQGSGYREECPTLGALAVHILLTAVSRTVRPELLKGLERCISAAHAAFCYDLVSDWLYAEDRSSLHEIAAFAASEAGLHERLMRLDLADLSRMAVFPCVNEIILLKLMQGMEQNTIAPSVVREIAEQRRTLAWYEDTRHFYEGFCAAADMQEFCHAHADGFHTVVPRKIWQEYTEEYYRFDTFYRRFHQCYDASLKCCHADLLDRFADVKDMAERLYVNWFLEELGTSWSNAVAEDLSTYGRVPDVPLQTDFYRHAVCPADARVYVIISDALRYEVAAELADDLRRETQCKAELGSMQGIFPTVTKFGMAALLPHRKLSVEERNGGLSVLADGVSTEAPRRDKILKAANPRSTALKYRDLIGMKRPERSALVRGMDVVYIYHDTIDEAGHSERSVFTACSDAIEEIKYMVRMITGEFSGTRILITADHGFLYTVHPLREDDKVDKMAASHQDVEVARRYAIMRKGPAPEYLLPVKFLDGDTAYDAFTPRGSLRIKMKGGGLNFVHGGISLQEMVVPLIDYRYLRNDSKEYQNNRARYETKPVTLHLLSSSRKISNMMFALNFFQKEPAAGNFRAAVYTLFFTDSNGNAVSDTARVIADKTSDKAEERTFRVGFNLKSLAYDSKEIYGLVIADEDGMTVRREEFTIDIAAAADEFDF